MVKIDGFGATVSLIVFVALLYIAYKAGQKGTLGAYIK